MIEFVKNHKKLSGFVAFISLVLGLVGWEASSGLRGYLVARVDVARGQRRRCRSAVRNSHWLG